MNPSDPTVVTAVHRALAEQLALVLAVLAVLGLAAALGSYRRWAGRGQPGAKWGSLRPAPEPRARRILRVGFGALWIIDGALQLQPAMALGVVPRVIRPAASGSPWWVQRLVGLASATWSFHPATVTAAIVWVEVGLGVGLIASSRGELSRIFGVLSACWGLVVWGLGEGVGGLFRPGVSWLTGAPGPALLYAVAGLLVALPESVWGSRRFATGLARATGVACCALAALQAWPGRGTWRGGGAGNALAQTLRQAAAARQPRLLGSLVGASARFDAAHAALVNLVAVLGLLGVAGSFLAARRRAVVAGAIGGSALCLLAWVLVQDLGLFGGTSTNPQSMLPMALLLIGACLAVVRRPGGDTGPITASAAIDPETPPGGGRLRGLGLRPVGALGALGVMLVGAVPLGLATLNTQASPLLTAAINGPPTALDAPAPGFTLEDQHGETVSLTSLRGRAVALTFLDDVCTTDCPIIAQEFRTADSLLGSDAARVELVAINANPRYVSPDYLDAFDRQEHLDGVPNWRFLTGALPQLRQVWASYGMIVGVAAGGSMVMHSYYTYLIDARGHTRLALGSDPGPATSATQSSFAVSLASGLRQVLRDS